MKSSIIIFILFNCYAVVAEWQTRCLQAAVGNTVRVQLPPTAPYDMMDEALIEILKQWNITSVLPLTVGDFKLSAPFAMEGEDEKTKEFVLFRYVNPTNGWSVRAVFNPGTEEYAIRTDIGMLEFALIEFITDDLELFKHLVEARLVRIVHDYYVEPSCNFSVIIKDKGLPDVHWDDILPAAYKGMVRLIQPNEAVRIINGSYMVLAYYDAATRSGLSLMYNVLRDDFFAERRIHNFPNLVHDFDSTKLSDLHQKLSAHLVPVLDQIAIDREHEGNEA